MSWPPLPRPDRSDEVRSIRIDAPMNRLATITLSSEKQREDYRRTLARMFELAFGGGYRPRSWWYRFLYWLGFRPWPYTHTFTPARPIHMPTMADYASLVDQFVWDWPK